MKGGGEEPKCISKIYLKGSLTKAASNFYLLYCPFSYSTTQMINSKCTTFSVLLLFCPRNSLMQPKLHLPIKNCTPGNLTGGSSLSSLRRSLSSLGTKRDLGMTPKVFSIREMDQQSSSTWGSKVPQHKSTFGESVEYCYSFFFFPTTNSYFFTI